MPYVGGDYAPATSALVERARALGHRNMAYVGLNEGAESTVDRWYGFSRAMGESAPVASILDVGRPPQETLDILIGAGTSCVFFTELSDAVRVEEAARARGLSVPGDLSIVVLGNHIRADEPGRRFTSFAIPREAMARQATEMLVRRVEHDAPVEQLLLPCEPLEGDTLGSPISRTKKTK